MDSAARERTQNSSEIKEEKTKVEEAYAQCTIETDFESII